MDVIKKDELNKLPDGFLKDYITFIINHCPTSYEWAEAQALTLLSLAASMDKFVHTKMGDINMHMYFLNCGPSRIAYKTLPVRNYTRPIIRKLSWLVGKDLLAPKRFSVEGMIEWITPSKSRQNKKRGKNPIGRPKKTSRKGIGGRGKRKKDIKELSDKEIEEIKKPKKNYLPDHSDEGAMIYDEFSAIFKDSKNKQYMSDVLEFLSEMDDGYIDKRKTITHGMQGGVDVFMSILAATTPDFFTSIDKGFFRQGTGNKFYYIMSEPQELHREYDDDDLEAQSFVGLMSGFSSEDRKTQLNEFADRIYQIRTKAPNVMEFTISAARLVYHYYQENHNISRERWDKDWKDLRYSFYSQRSVSMMKMAGLYTLSKNEANVVSEKISKDEDVLVITESAIKWAIHRMNVYTEEFNKLLDMWPQAISSEERMRTLDGYFAAIESIIHRTDGKISLSDLKRKSGLGNTRFREIINTMISTGRIFGMKVEESPGGDKGGRKPVMYSLSPFVKDDEETTD